MIQFCGRLEYGSRYHNCPPCIQEVIGGRGSELRINEAQFCENLLRQIDGFAYDKKRSTENIGWLIKRMYIICVCMCLYVSFYVYVFVCMYDCVCMCLYLCPILDRRQPSIESSRNLHTVPVVFALSFALSSFHHKLPCSLCSLVSLPHSYEGSLLPILPLLLPPPLVLLNSSRKKGQINVRTKDVVSSMSNLTVN